ncbi:MAG TPA: phosphodiester glycosidase family protein [Kofleriaceae bacterium]|nr:phosphodiester glycosidase family protein [Kofleriaceae bacterium]
MRAVLLAAAVTVLAPTVAHASDTWTDPFPGVRRLHRVTSDQNINVLKVDLCAPGVSIRTTASGERQRTVSSFGALVGAQAAVNGDFFSFNDYSTNGPAMDGGAAWGGGDGNYVAPIQFGANKVAIPPHESTAGVESWAREVVSGHPSLLVGGARRDNNGDSLCTTRNPRTALGFSADRRTLFVAVIDGRATGRIGMTCDEMVALFTELGAADAVNLDGGGSSTMWLQGTGVVNNPSDGSQRVVGNHLAIKAGGSGAAPHCPVPAYAASFVALDAPMTMVSGDEAVVWMDLRNDGNTVWDLDKTRIGTQAPQDRSSAFYKEGNWIAPNRPSGADHSNYGPGVVGRFTWVMKAPEVDHETRFDEAFQPVQEGVTWFGPMQTMSITVEPRDGAGDSDAGVDPADGDAATGEGGDGSTSGGCSAGGPGGPGGGAGGVGGVLVLLALAGLARRKR